MSVVYDEKLLDKTGLAMVPSAYKGAADEGNTSGFLGKVYSVLPAQTTSDNLVINGTFDTDSDWTKVGVVSISNGVATLDGDGQTSLCYQSNIVEEGKNYIATFEISNYNGLGDARLIDDTGAAYYTITQDGIFTISFKAKVHPNGNFLFRAKNGALFSIDNVKLQLISDGDFDFSRGSDATRVNSQGYIESVQVLSDELVQNGDFEEIGSELIDYSSITYGAGGWSLVNDKWVFDDVTSGFINTNSFNVLAGEVYKVVVDVSVPSGLANFRFTSGNSQTVLFDYKNFSDGVTTFYTKVSGVNGNIVRLYAPTSLSDSFTLNSISVQRVGQNWTFGDGWSMGDGKVIADGTMTSADTLNHAYNFTDGNKYRFNFTISDYQSGSVYIREPFDGSADAVSSNGTFTFDYIAGAANEIRFRSNDGFTGSIDNVSVKEVTDDTDIPRLDYSDGCPTLLLEPQRTNEISNSQHLGQELVGNRMDINDSVDTSPEGVVNASKLVPSTDVNTTHQSDTILVGNFSSGDAVTVSIFAKADGYDGIILRFTDGTAAFTTNKVAKFDLSRGRWNNNSMDGTTGNMVGEVGMEDYGNGWYRCFATATTDASGNVNIRIPVVDVTAQDSYDETFTGDATSGVLIYGLQVEGGSYPTSYIPTNGETNGVTRLADICNNAGDSTIFNDSEGVLYWEYQPLSTSETQQLTVSDGTSSNTSFITFSSNGSINTNNISFAGANDGLGYKKVAARHNNGTYSLFVDGKFIETATNPTISGLKSMQFGQANLGGSLRPYGKTRSVLFFDEALSNAELEYITSSDIDVVLQNNKLKATMLGDTYEDGHVEDRLNELF